MGKIIIVMALVWIVGMFIGVYCMDRKDGYL
jgi:hypothetical protein